MTLIAPPELAPYADRYADDRAHVPLRVVVTLRSPLVDYDPVNLDNLLARCVVDEATGDAGLPPSPQPYALPVPLRCLWWSDDGLPLWAMTPFQPVGEAVRDVAYWHKRQQSGRFTGTPSGTFSIAATSGRWMERRVPMPTALADQWQATAIGDPEEIARLLAPLSHLGKRRSSGYGAVVGWRVEPLDAYHLVGDGVLLRALPADAVRLLDGGLPDGAPAPIGWTPPQWKPDLFRPGWWPGTPVV